MIGHKEWELARKACTVFNDLFASPEDILKAYHRSITKKVNNLSEGKIRDEEMESNCQALAAEIFKHKYLISEDVLSLKIANNPPSYKETSNFKLTDKEEAKYCKGIALELFETLLKIVCNERKRNQVIK